jgi:hypothetical protein
MKKMFIVMMVAAFAVAACGGKKTAPAKPDQGSATEPAKPTEGSGEAPKGDAPPPSM